MNRVNAIISTVIFLSSVACTRDASQKDGIDDLNQGEILLSEARIRMRNKLTAPPQEITDPLGDELKKLAKMSQKNSYDTLEMQRFLEIEPADFQNNVEFSQLYNETLFRMMEREPKKFVKSAINSKEKAWQNLNEQIRTPVNDRLKTDVVKEKMQKEVQRQWQIRELNIESNDEQEITLEYEKFKTVNRVFDGRNEQLREPQKLIQIRRRDSIQRHLSPRPALPQQPVFERATLDTIQ